MTDIYVRNLDNAQPVVWKPKINLCPQDCGGVEYDTINYVPHCPTCDKEFEHSFITNYCPNCGTKLWGQYKAPIILEEDK